MTIDGEPVPPFVAVECAVRIVEALQHCGMPVRAMLTMLDEEWESAFVSLCAADPRRPRDYL